MITALAKKSYETIIENPSITLYFVLYLIILNFLGAYAITATNFYVLITLIVAALMVSMAFTSGWLQIMEESIDKEKIREKNYFSIFLEGTGKNIIPITIAMTMLCILFLALVALANIAANALYGNFNSVLNDILISATQAANNNDFIKNLTDNQAYILSVWQIIINVLGAICSFIFMYYFPSIIKSSCENPFLKPFVELWRSLCFLFKNFFSSLAIFLIIMIINTTLNILKGLSLNNSILIILLLFVWIYFISWSIMLIFNYYEQKNIRDNGSDRIEQDENSDSISTQD